MRYSLRPRHAFTLVELLTVMAIIGILAALILSVARSASDQARRKRAEAEIQGFSTGLESFKADNGDYPRCLPNSDTMVSDNVDPRNGNSAGDLPSASRVLYVGLSGDVNLNQTPGNGNGMKTYFEFRPKMLHLGVGGAIDSLVDPWGNVYGYSTACHADAIAGKSATSTRGYNPTFDLWSTANSTAGTSITWIKNW